MTQGLLCVPTISKHKSMTQTGVQELYDLKINLTNDPCFALNVEKM